MLIWFKRFLNFSKSNNGHFSMSGSSSVLHIKLTNRKVMLFFPSWLR